MKINIIILVWWRRSRRWRSLWIPPCAYVVRSAAYPSCRSSRGNRLSPVCTVAGVLQSQRELDYYIVTGRQFRRCRYRQRRPVYNYFENVWSHQNNGFQFDFSKICWGGAHQAPPLTSLPVFLELCLWLGFRPWFSAARAFDSGFALDC